MTAPLSPAKQKIRPWLNASVRKSMVASVFVFLFGMCWRASHIEEGTIGDPVKRTAEKEQIHKDFEQLGQISRDLSSVQELQKTLWEARNSADWLKSRMKAPDVKITYDRAWLEAAEKQLEKQFEEKSHQVELQLIHSQNLSERDFITLSQEFVKGSGRKNLIYMFEDKLQGDYPMTHVHGMHECQREAAAKLGAPPTEETAREIKSCTDGKYDGRKMTVYAGMGGVICLGFYGRSLRKKWDVVTAAAQTTSIPAPPETPVADGMPIVVITSQPVTMKPIKIRKALA